MHSTTAALFRGVRMANPKSDTLQKVEQDLRQQEGLIPLRPSAYTCEVWWVNICTTQTQHRPFGKGPESGEKSQTRTTDSSCHTSCHNCCLLSPVQNCPDGWATRCMGRSWAEQANNCANAKPKKTPTSPQPGTKSRHKPGERPNQLPCPDPPYSRS